MWLTRFFFFHFAKACNFNQVSFVCRLLFIYLFIYFFGLLVCISITLGKWPKKTLLSLFSYSVMSNSLRDPIDYSVPGFLVLHWLQELAQTQLHFGDAIQPSQPLLSPPPPALNLFQYQGLFQWVGSSHQVVKLLELQLQHQSFQWIFRVDFL